jgi:hypothetical protein
MGHRLEDRASAARCPIQRTWTFAILCRSYGAAPRFGYGSYKDFAPTEGVTILVECSRGRSRENGKMNEISVPGKGELFWRELSQRCDGSRLAQESVGPQ